MIHYKLNKNLNNHFQCSIELTSVLQILFAASTMKKIIGNEGFKPIYLLVYVANDHVNQKTIDISLSLLEKLNFINDMKIFFHDMRINRIDFSCDIAIVRTRIDRTSYNNWHFDRSFFIEIGNCKLLKIILRDLKCNRIIGVDDGLSNWRSIKKNLYFDLSKITHLIRGMISPKFFPRIISSNSNVNIFSIFQEKQFNIQKEFLHIVDELSVFYNYKINVKNLFLLAWPSKRRDELSSFLELQINILACHLDKINWNPNEKIYLKSHPKINLKEKIFHPIYQLEYLSIDNGIPTEVLITSMKNLNIIFSFPTTTAFLIKSGKINCTANVEILTTNEDGFFKENLEAFYDL